MEVLEVVGATADKGIEMIPAFAKAASRSSCRAFRVAKRALKSTCAMRFESVSYKVAKKGELTRRKRSKERVIYEVLRHRGPLRAALSAETQ